MGVLKESQYQDLTAVRDGQDRSRHGWVTDGCGIDLKAVDALRKIGLCEMAEGRARSVGPANRLARDYGSQYEATNRSRSL
ncbi:hypothetical protein V7793_05320 [Streptomyces sp. KLMMK]|uniref:hypothetical protein n=1 Tax=Streptomyces sp. KLMMK TaxID=3109353 RepID=UPI002FFE3327